MVAAIGFTTPLMLLGLGFLSLPILAHLLHRRARRRLVFPSILLLVESSASQSQLFKLRRWLLLALRCLAVAFIALAFARPLWRETAGAAATTGEGARIVLLVDASASTAQEVGGVAAMESLRAAADRALNSLLLGADAVNIVHATARPRAAFPAMTSNLELIRGEIESIRPTAERADLPVALGIAGKLLSSAGGEGPRHLVILSDLQETNWSGVLDRAARDRSLPEGTSLTFVPLAAPVPDNVGLHEPAVVPRTPLEGQPSTVSVTVSLHGSRARQVKIELQVDGAPADSRSIRLAPWQERQVAFSVRFSGAGPRRVEFSTGRDGLEIDNHAYTVARVVERIPVAVVGDDDPGEPGTFSYFTSRALAPRDGRGDRYRVRHLPGGELSARRLEDTAAVIVGDIGRLSRSALTALHDYLTGGGGVALFCGAGPVAENLLALDRLEEKGLLPWKPGALRDLAARGDGLSLGDGQWQSSLLADFDQRSQLALSRVRFGRLRATGPASPEAQILLRFVDGTAALGRRAVGAGKLLVANFSPALDSSDLGKYGSFVALVHSIVRELRSDRARRAGAIAGEALTLPIGAGVELGGEKLELRGPGGLAVPGSELYGTGEGLTVSLPRAGQPGFYVAVKGERTVGMTAVNVDPRESDLRRIETTRLKETLRTGEAPVEVRDPAEDGALNIRGRPLWGWMLAVALAALAAELILLGLWRR